MAQTPDHILVKLDPRELNAILTPILDEINDLRRRVKKLEGNFPQNSEPNSTLEPTS